METSKEVSLNLETENSTEVEKVNGTFVESEINLLRRFIGFVDRVRETKLLQNGIPAITNKNWHPDTGMIWTCQSYENNELYELLHVLRPLILSKEATSYERIAGLFGKKFKSENFRAYLKRQRTIYEDGELILYMQIRLNDQPLLAGSTLKLWLNGEQYHSDQEKADAWKKIERMLTSENARALIINQLQAKVKALFYLQYIAKLILE